MSGFHKGTLPTAIRASNNNQMAAGAVFNIDRELAKIYYHVSGLAAYSGVERQFLRAR
jgi:hypothetical protein